MIKPSEIRIKAERKYPFYLQSQIIKSVFFPLLIPGDKIPGKSLGQLQSEIQELVKQSKETRGYGFTIEYKTIKTKNIGTQSLPMSIYFDSEKDYLKYLGKEKEVESFQHDYNKIMAVFPELHLWALNNPLKIIQNQNHWDGLLMVCSYFKNNPAPKLYIRELPINVHTKFVEINQSILKEILDIIIEPAINTSESDFTKRYNLKFDEPLVRFKVLDNIISQSFYSGINDISLPISQFERINLPLKRVIIVENKTSLYTALTLPRIEGAIAIFGSGFSVNRIKNTKWLKETEILYWGDLDAQGFEILSQVRNYFPQTKSILMDEKTFIKFFENDLGTPSQVLKELNLTDNEKLLYDKLKVNNWRLEQEKIPFDYVNQFFENENI